MRHVNFYLMGCCAAVGSATSFTLAGPFSTGLGNTNAGAVDPAIPGFVGPAGDGKTTSPNVVNPLFSGWATTCTSYLPAPAVDARWSDPAKALGPVTGDNFDIVSLGDLNSTQIAAGTPPGQITLSFSGGIRNTAGADFAIFENSLGTGSLVFAELAYVEVSSDGQHFARFPSDSLTPSAVGAFGQIDPTNVHNLPGKHVNSGGNSWGTPFDLSDLNNDALVQSGQVNLHGIQFVRLIDIPGDGSFHDFNGHPIYDAWPTVGSGGFDLEAIGATHNWLGGDANLDGVVDVTDLGALATHWQQAGQWSDGDFTHDGVVNVSDLGILATNWQAGAESLSAALARVPEPSSLLAFLSAALLLRRRVSCCIAMLFTVLLAGSAMASTADFEDLSVPASHYYNGSDGAGGFTSRGVHFGNSYNTTFGSWSGFAYSNINNTTTAGYGNQYAAITGAGFGGGGVYGVGYDGATLTLPSVAPVQSLRVTNTTYAYLAIRDGNDGFGAVRQFGDDPAQPGSSNQGYADWYKLTITGKDAAGQSVGSINFYLADYRFADNASDYVINDWRLVDLSSLGGVKSLSFSLDSSDTGQFGVNTPTYFALDDVTFVPEPSIGAAVVLIAFAMARRRN
jgi:hypothetical protein